MHVFIQHIIHQIIRPCKRLHPLKSHESPSIHPPPLCYSWHRLNPTWRPLLASLLPLGQTQKITLLFFFSWASSNRRLNEDIQPPVRPRSRLPLLSAGIHRGHVYGEFTADMHTENMCEEEGGLCVTEAKLLIL